MTTDFEGKTRLVSDSEPSLLELNGALLWLFFPLGKLDFRWAQLINTFLLRTHPLEALC